jgi:hypothetical protein
MPHQLIATSSKERQQSLCPQQKNKTAPKGSFASGRRVRTRFKEYRARQEATRSITAKLRAERLARETIDGKAKSERKKATRA